MTDTEGSGGGGVKCPVHLLFGIHVTMAGTEHGAAYCPLCLFPRVSR